MLSGRGWKLDDLGARKAFIRLSLFSLPRKAFASKESLASKESSGFQRKLRSATRFRRVVLQGVPRTVEAACFQSCLVELLPEGVGFVRHCLSLVHPGTPKCHANCVSAVEWRVEASCVLPKSLSADVQSDQTAASRIKVIQILLRCCSFIQCSLREHSSDSKRLDSPLT